MSTPAAGRRLRLILAAIWLLDAALQKRWPAWRRLRGFLAGTA
jgi:hypothetical protein